MRIRMRWCIHCTWIFDMNIFRTTCAHKTVSFGIWCGGMVHICAKQQKQITFNDEICRLDSWYSWCVWDWATKPDIFPHWTSRSSDDSSVVMPKRAFDMAKLLWAFRRAHVKPLMNASWLYLNKKKTASNIPMHVVRQHRNIDRPIIEGYHDISPIRIRRSAVRPQSLRIVRCDHPYIAADTKTHIEAHRNMNKQLEYTRRHLEQIDAIQTVASALAININNQQHKHTTECRRRRSSNHRNQIPIFHR